MEIRAYAPGDLEAVVRLWHAAKRDVFLALVAKPSGSSSYLDRLYVQPDAQRRGVGGALLGKARELSPTGLELHTHQRNRRARAFYARHGLRAVRFGVSPPPESESDVEYHWSPRSPLG